MKLSQWAKIWGVSDEALADLRAGLGIDDNVNPLPTTTYSASEAAVSNIIRLEASNKGCRLWRNNVGATYTTNGDFIRYGLANSSAGENKQIKSADLIGIRPVLITPDMVGRTIGQFLSREVKAGDWVFKGTDRELAQMRWAALITSLGGDAKFATKEGTI